MTKIAVKNSPRIVALLQCYNEMRYLEGWYENLKGRVNAIIALDHGSNDGSSEFISNQPETTKLIINSASKKQEWNEVENRQVLIKAGQEIKANWFLTIDADERLEDLFWKELERILILAHQEDY